MSMKWANPDHKAIILADGSVAGLTVAGDVSSIGNGPSRRAVQAFVAGGGIIAAADPIVPPPPPPPKDSQPLTAAETLALINAGRGRPLTNADLPDRVKP